MYENTIVAGSSGMHYIGLTNLKVLMKDVVYIEDDPVNAFVFERMLKGVHKVTHYQNGETYLEVTYDDDPDIIFVDIKLGNGRMDGVEIMKRIKEIKAQQAVPVIAITAFAFKQDEERFLSEGFDGYLSKPVSKKTLLETLGKFVTDP